MNSAMTETANFTPTGTQYTISGQVTVTPSFAVAGSAGSGLPLLTMTYSGGLNGTTTTDGNGNYLLIAPAAGNYTLTPQNAAYSFSPPAISIQNLSANTIAPLVAFPEGCHLRIGTANPIVNRTGDNEVTGSGWGEPSAEVAIQGSWSITNTVTLLFTPPGGTEQAVASDHTTVNWDNNTPFGNASRVSVNVTSALEPQGAGSYRTKMVFTGTCGGQTSDLDPDFSDSIQILRPVVGGQSGIWWLGSGGVDPDNGYYNQSLLTVLTNSGCPNCTAVPGWTVTGNAAKIALSCLSCASTTATSQGFSANVADITIRANISGFQSDPFYMTVSSPSYLVATQPYRYDVPYNDGWETRMFYTTRDVFNNALPSIAINEMFDIPWQDDYFNSTGVHNNWLPPTAGVLESYPGTLWYDKLSESGCAACTPPNRNPIDFNLGLVRVQSTGQKWYVGSRVFGVGIHVQDNIHDRFTDHGDHRLVISPIP
jgi:hypothetical protein